MFIPEYTITDQILKNIANIEYTKCLVDTVPILPFFEKQLEKEALTKNITTLLSLQGIKIYDEDVSYYLTYNEVELPSYIKQTLEVINLANGGSLNENDLRRFYSKLINLEDDSNLSYRRRVIENHPKPEEILAKLVELIDWYHSKDTINIHPVLISAIVRVQIDLIQPFDTLNNIVSLLAKKRSLNVFGYHFKKYISPEISLETADKNYHNILHGITNKDEDFTQALEYLINDIAIKTSRLKDEIMDMAKETKVAKATGTTTLTERQQTIMAYIQDYGSLKNADFARIFPTISEDSVLRDLKTLMSKNLIVKTGSTKSSRYEMVN